MEKYLNRIGLGCQIFVLAILIYFSIPNYTYVPIIQSSLDGQVVSILLYVLPVVVLFICVYYLVLLLKSIFKIKAKEMLRTFLLFLLDLSLPVLLLIVIFFGTPKLIQLCEPTYGWHEESAVSISIDRCNWIIKQGDSGTWVDCFSNELNRIENKIDNKRLLMDAILKNDEPHMFIHAFCMIKEYNFKDGDQILAKYMDDDRTSIMYSVSELA